MLVSQDSEGGARKFIGGNGSGDLRIRFGDQAVQDGEIALWEDVLSQRTESSHEDYVGSFVIPLTRLAVDGCLTAMLLR